MRAQEFITESADEEAWELVGQPVPEIQAFVRQIGMANDQQSVAKISSAIEATPDTPLPAASIPRLKNLANKPGDPGILRAIQKISGQPDAVKHYAALMARRDAGEGRDRGYDVSNLITAVRDGQYESPVLLRLPTGVYVIGGRTRLYAALALNVPIKVKIIGPQTFAKQAIQEYKTVPFRGMEMSIDEGEDGFKLTARTADGRKLGFVEFSFDTLGTIQAEELEVDERYRGQGIAATMYDYVKSLGYKIRRSDQQTPAGAAFWDRHHPGSNIWETQKNDLYPVTGRQFSRSNTTKDSKIKTLKEYIDMIESPDSGRRGFLKGLAGFAATSAIPKPIVKALSTPQGISTLSVAGALALLKAVRDNLDQFDAEDDDDYYDAWEEMANTLGFEWSDDDDSENNPTSKLSDLMNTYEENPETAAKQLIQHLQGQVIDPNMKFEPRDDWRQQARIERGEKLERDPSTGRLGWTNDQADAAVSQVAKTAASTVARTQAAPAVAAGLAAFKELVKKVVGNAPAVQTQPAKDMGRIEPASTALALPAPDKTAGEIMAQLRDIVGRDLTDQEKVVVKQEINQENRS